MQPQAQSLQDAARRAWAGCDRLRRRTDIGPAVLLAYHELWFSLGCRPGCYDVTLNELGAACGCTHRAAAKWLDRLVALRLVEIVANDAGTLRLYVYGPDEWEGPSRVADDAQRALPGFDEPAHPPPISDGAVADLSVPKGPDLSAHKGPPVDPEIAGVQAFILQRRQDFEREAVHSRDGPFGTERSELELRALQLNKNLKKSSELQHAERSAAADRSATAPPPPPQIRALSIEAAEDFRRRVASLTDELVRRIPSLARSVARNMADGALRGLFEWDDVERLVDRSLTAEVPWQYFVAGAKQKYRDVKARWPSWTRHQKGGSS